MNKNITSRWFYLNLNLHYYFFFQEVIVMTENKQFTTASSNFSHHSGSSYSQPYRFGGRVGLFGHYLRSLKIILLLTCIKLDATTKNGSRNPNSSNQQSQHKVVDHILKGICDLASSIGMSNFYFKISPLGGDLLEVS